MTLNEIISVFLLWFLDSLVGTLRLKYNNCIRSLQQCDVGKLRKTCHKINFDESTGFVDIAELAD